MKSSEPAGEHHGSVFPVIYATLTVALGLLTLLGWILNWPLLASLGATRIPMAPSTAILLLVYGSALGWRAWAPLSRRAYWGSLAMTGLGMLVVLLLVVLAGLDIHWYVEHFGLKLPAMAGGAPIGRGGGAPAAAAGFGSGARFLRTSTCTTFERPWLKLCRTEPASTVRPNPSCPEGRRESLPLPPS